MSTPTRPWNAAWHTWAAEHDLDPAQALAIAHGSPAGNTVRRLLPHLDEDATATASQRQLALQYDDLHDITATRGAHDLIAALARLRLPWAVVTSADTRLAKARLAAAGIDAPVLVTTDDITAGKPSPEGYLRAAELLDTPPARCLVVEDADVGIQAGRAAGARTAGLKGVAADLPIDDLSHLTQLLLAGHS